jgi:carbonic anhydrase
MAHHCKYLIAHCIDFRIQKSVKQFMEEEKLVGDCDAVSVAGAVKNIEFLLGQIEISARLHKMKKVILANHTDCGAYGGSSKFNSAEEEKKFHIEEMEKAKTAILEKHPELLVKMLLVNILPSGQIEIEKISG